MIYYAVIIQNIAMVDKFFTTGDTEWISSIGISEIIRVVLNERLVATLKRRSSSAKPGFRPGYIILHNQQSFPVFDQLSRLLYQD